MEVEIEVTVSTTDDKPVTIETSPMETVAEPNNNIQADDLASDPLPSVVEGSEAWHSLFPIEWLPIISRDIARQARQVIF